MPLVYLFCMLLSEHFCFQNRLHETLRIMQLGERGEGRSLKYLMETTHAFFKVILNNVEPVPIL